MDIEEEIRNILCEIGKEVKLHKLKDGNFIIDIDYDKYVKELLDLLNQDNS